MGKIKFKLNSGREVELDSFTFGYSYQNLLEGDPTEEINQFIYNKIDYPDNWGPRKVYKIEPSKDEFQNSLKEVYYIVWLSSQPIKSGFHGSELVIIWFDNAPSNRTIEDIVINGVKSINWDELGDDFEY